MEQKQTTVQSQDIQNGKEVLKKEAKALLALSETLGDVFAQAVDVLYSTTGRVIVTGMGKSGHIGNKIAATLASTGTPSFFVHPGEASHGDLGMITKEDVVIALSHTGGTKELSDILAHCTRFSVPLIALTGKADSVLGQASDFCLLDGVSQEACPNNQAPTTSTTATLALGDALAVALMHRRGFKSEDFAVFHPGGKLGVRMASVSTFMLSGDDLPLVAPSVKMDEVIIEMSKKSQGTVGVVDAEGVLQGIVTDGDLRRHLSENLLSKKVTEVMTVSPLTVSATSLATKAVKLMQDKKITSLFVVNERGCVEGLLHIHHCLQAGVI